MPPILATIDDINAHLDGQVINADEINTELLQVSVARVIRGYLSRVIPVSTLATWTEPDLTPEIIREVAGMLIAAQLFFDKTAQTTVEVADRHYAQILYDRAMKTLDQIIEGLIEIPEIVVDPVAGLSTEDFFPVDDTDRAFSMSMEL